MGVKIFLLAAALRGAAAGGGLRAGEGLRAEIALRPHHAARVVHAATGAPARRLGASSTLLVASGARNLTLELAPDVTAFHPHYKELAIEGGRIVETRADARGCHYAGAATSEAGEGRATARTCGGRLEAVIRFEDRVLELAWHEGAHVLFDAHADRVDGRTAPSTCGVDKRHRAPGRRDHDEDSRGHASRDEDSLDLSRGGDSHSRDEASRDHSHKDDHDHDHSHQDDHDHDQDHSHASLGLRRRLAAGECDGEPTK